MICSQLLSKDDATLKQQAAPPTPATARSNNETTALEASQSPGSRVLTAPKGSIGNDYKTYDVQSKAPARVHTLEVPNWVDEVAGDEDISVSGGGPVRNIQSQGCNNHTLSRPHYERQCARSIFLSKLPDNTTHADITQAIRGGQLLDIYLRPNDGTAAVSFLLAADARAFYDHVKRHDLYINQKRVSGSRSPRQRVNLFAGSSGITLTAIRSKFAGMIVNSYCPAMSPARSVSVLLGIS